MKDVLIIGGAGNIGHKLINTLLEDYSVTVLDLKSNLALKRMTEYENKIKIVYGDIEDYHLVKDLVKKNDIVINLAGIMPPLAEFHESICNSTNYMGSKNIVDAILEVNKSCLYVYASFISVYGKTPNIEHKISVKEGINNPEDNYSINLMRSENYIKEKLKKYIILRMPIVLTPNNYYIKHMTLNRMVDFITVDDLNNSILSIVQNEKTYGKTYNISGFKTNSTTFIKNMYKYSGRISMFRRNLYYGEYSDDQIINKITKINYSKPGDYYRVLKKENFIVLRYIRKFINLPKYIYYKIKTK